MTSKKKVWATFAAVSAALVAFDLLLKTWAHANLQNRPPIDLLPGFLGLTYHENPGAAFGFLAGAAWGRYFLTVVVVLLLAAMLWYYWRMPLEKKAWFIRIPVMFIFAGGVGNLFDRLAFGAVRDMLEFLFINFPIFNLADVYVTGGVVAMMFFSLVVFRDFPYLND